MAQLPKELGVRSLHPTFLFLQFLQGNIAIQIHTSLLSTESDRKQLEVYDALREVISKAWQSIR
jgi:hypothetical protein